MSFFIIFVFALLTKPLFNTPLAQGKLSFTKTYFLYGLGGIIVFVFIYVNFVGGYLIDNGSSRGEREIRTIIRTVMLACTIYFSCLCFAINKIKIKSTSFIAKSYCTFFMLILGISVLGFAFFNWFYTLLYILFSWLLFKFVWKEKFFNY